MKHRSVSHNLCGHSYSCRFDAKKNFVWHWKPIFCAAMCQNKHCASRTSEKEGACERCQQWRKSMKKFSHSRPRWCPERASSRRLLIVCRRQWEMRKVAVCSFRKRHTWQHFSWFMVARWAPALSLRTIDTQILNNRSSYDGSHHWKTCLVRQNHLG